MGVSINIKQILYCIILLANCNIRGYISKIMKDFVIEDRIGCNPATEFQIN